MNRRVDQKLHLAELTLAALDAKFPSQNNSPAEAALVDAAIFHLHVAYRAYLHELLSPSKITADACTARQAADALRIERLQNGDIDELVELERSRAWPAQLCSAYADAERHAMSESHTPSEGIALCDVTARIEREVVAGWLQQFQILLGRQREHAREW